MNAGFSRIIRVYRIFCNIESMILIEITDRAVYNGEKPNDHKAFRYGI